ncbi:MAG: formylglycine-generating enzyme family protein [Victivallales bacterium]|nr:formylglycine-generating enzyme family protein [Victivallales bacterium]
MKKRILAGVLLAVFGVYGGLGQEAKAPQTISTKTGIKMVLIPGGKFKMGSKAGQEDERRVHEVELDSFYMDVHEVTQESFQELTGMNPSKFRDRKGPVERIRWTEAVLYCNARSVKEGLKPAYNTETWKCDFSADGYRLPTEAEWEYACRAGTKDSRFFSGDDAMLGKYAWYRGNSREKVHPVGTKRPNPFGLFDIYGNVLEWCNDFYGQDYYAQSPVKNPRGPDSGSKRVLRGGSWASRPARCNSTRRFSDNPVTADICQGYDTYGFRCVRPAGKPQKNRKP